MHTPDVTTQKTHPDPNQCPACDAWEYGDGFQCPIHGEEAQFRGVNLDTGEPLTDERIDP